MGEGGGRGRGPDQSGSCLISIWQLPDQSGSRLILLWWLPDSSGSRLILIRQCLIYRYIQISYSQTCSNPVNYEAS